MRSTTIAIALLLSCAAVPQAAFAQTPPTTASDAPKPYLAVDQLPDPKAYLADPPAPGTAAYAADRSAYEDALKGRDGAAWKDAQRQVSIRSTLVQGQIMCALGARLDPSPATAFGRLLQRSGATLSLASERSKAIWKRGRPYLGDKAAVLCDPDPSFGTQSPSYPSGHAGIGWLWGLMLSEIAPERSGELLRWGAEVGSNRVACRVHYPSDIVAGRQLGAVLYARLQADAAFRADMAAAKVEFAAARAAGKTATCAAE